MDFDNGYLDAENAVAQSVPGVREAARIRDNGADAFSVFVDIEFSAGCRDGLYTLDRFGGVYTLGAARKVEDEPGSGFGNSPYFFPNLYARDLEIFSLAESETSATR